MIACVEHPAGRHLEVTGAGDDAIARLTKARQDSLSELLEGWDPGEHPEVVAMIHELARVLMADDDRLLADAHAT